MLKFQQDDSPVINDDKRAAIEQDAREQQDDFLTVSSRDSAVKRGTIVLAVLFAVGLAGVFIMVKKATPSSAAAGEPMEDAILQATVARMTGISQDQTDDMEQVVGRFYELSNITQVKVNELRKNPFILDRSLIGQAADLSGGDASMEAALAVRRRLQDKLKNFHLVGIMTSPQGNLCMIDDRVVRKGDALGEFAVVDVLDDGVVLSAQGMQFELKIAAE